MSSDELIGTNIGHFQIKDVIGAGGMGVVYLAVDTSLEREVALKLLPEALAVEPERRSRFLREARAAAQLIHPNIATVFEVGEAGDQLYLAMELIEGSSLRALLDDGPLGLEEAARVARSVGRALVKAHGAGIVHRDLKPDNVMVASDGLIKVLDFGLAKLRVAEEAPESATQMESAETATNVTAEGRILGTPGYMSPEQARGQQVDHRTDLFALGVMLREMLTGEPTFGGATPLDRLAAVTRDEPEPLHGVPPQLNELITSCLTKDRDERIDDAESFLVALSAAVGASSDTMLSAPGASRPGAAKSLAGDSSVDRADAKTAATDMGAATSKASAVATGAKRPRWLLAAISAAVAAAAIIGLVRWRGGGAEPSATTAGPDGAATWNDPASVLACPPLKASGVPEPAGWLGAAAADIVCRRATLLMGGPYERTLVPAQLLDMPTKVVASIPEDVYGDPDSRPRALEAAAARAHGWVDGSVLKDTKGFTTELILRTRGGDEIGRAEGSGRYLHRAVQAAMEPLLKSGALPERDALDPEVARWLRTKAPRAAVAVLDLELATALFLGRPPPEECAGVARHQQAFESFAPIEAMCTAVTKGPDAVKPLAVDRSSPEAFAWTAPLAVQHDDKLDAMALSREAQRMLDAEKSALGRGTLGTVTASLMESAHESVRMLAFATVQDDSRHWWTWQIACGASMRQEGGEVANRGFQTWTPAMPDAWNIGTFADPKRKLADKIRLGERAVALSPDYPLFAQNLAKFLVQAGRNEDVRSLAATLARGGPSQRVGAEALLAEVEGSEGKFERSLTRGLAAHHKLEVITRLWWGDLSLTDQTLDMAVLLDRHHAVADELAERFVLADPTRLYAHDWYTTYQAALICLHASEPVAKRCVARLNELLAADFFRLGQVPDALKMLEGLTRYLDGDIDGMVKTWRSMPAAVRGWEMRARLLAQVGRDDLAAKIDGELPIGHGAYHGASLADPRRALRAEKAGDHDKARELAQKVVDAWSAADADVPAVAKMRALLERLR